MPTPDYLRALREQKDAREAIRAQFVYETLRIEGAAVTFPQVRDIVTDERVTGPARVEEVRLAANLGAAFDAVIEHAGRPIRAEVMRRMHATILDGTDCAREVGANVGDWKTMPNGLNGHPTTPPADVPPPSQCS